MVTMEITYRAGGSDSIPSCDFEEALSRLSLIHGNRPVSSVEVWYQECVISPLKSSVHDIQIMLLKWKEYRCYA